MECGCFNQTASLTVQLFVVVGLPEENRNTMYVRKYGGRPSWRCHVIGRSNWAKGRDPSGSWVQYPNPAVSMIPRHARCNILTHYCVAILL